MSDLGLPKARADDDDSTGGIASLLARYRDEWDLALEGRPEPKLAAYLTQSSPDVRTTVRAELEKIDREYRARRSPTGRADTEQGNREATIAEAPPHQSAPATILQGPSDANAPSGPPSPAAHEDQSDRGATIGWEHGEGAAGDQSEPSKSSSSDGLKDYELLGELGRGGMGVVFKAREKSVNRTVALKMMLGGGFASPEHVRRFRVEAEAVASLDHPNIVSIFHVGEASGSPYFTMRYIEGSALDEKGGDQFRSPRAAAGLMHKICQAVDYAHKRGVLHRDLKPANILIDPDGEPHITDFGLAKRLGENEGATRTGAVMGTPDYMSPEQAAGNTRKVSVASDVYSLGSILFDLLTGEPPFRSPTVMETLIRVTKEPARAPTMLNRAVDPDLETICMKCLEKEPEKRYASAQDLAEELGRYLVGEPIAARRVGRMERTRRWCKRNPVVASLMAAVMVLVAAWLVGLNVALMRISAEKEQAVKSQKAAIESEKAAKAARDEARRNEAFAVQTLNDAIRIFHDGLRDQPGLSSLRDRLLFTVAEKLKDFRQNAEEPTPLDGRGTAELLRTTTIALNQRFGDALFAAGRVEDALPYYQMMERLTREWHDDSPEHPEAKKSMAACSNKLADTLIRLGELKAARDYYRNGLEYRQQWVALLKKQWIELQKDGRNADALALDDAEWAVINAKWDVSISYALLSDSNLHMGNPFAAREALQQSEPWAAPVLEKTRLQDASDIEVLSLRDAGFKKLKDYIDMSLRFERHADVYWRVDGFEPARAQYANAIETLEQGLQHPGIPKLRIRRQLARCHVSLGDAYLRLKGAVPDAAGHFERAVKLCEAILAQDAEDTEAKVLLANGLYSQGVAALRANNFAHGRALFQRCLDLRQNISAAAPQDMLLQADLMMALARLGLRKEAMDVAATIRQQFDEPVASYLAARCYSVCAGSRKGASRDGQPPEPEEEISLRDEYQSKALDAIRDAIRHGWRDRRSLETDPDLEYIDLSPLLGEAL